MSAHTPGPWKVDQFGDPVVWTDGDAYGHGQMRIADLRGWGHLTGGGACALPHPEAAAIQDANARLIAAAPELLEWLKREHAINNMPGGCGNGPACRTCALLAKAEGR